MRVAEVMTRGVDAVAPTATVQEAATQMAEFDVGAVLVGDERALVGVLTDRDVILRVVVEGRHPAETIVQDVMSKALYTCRDDDAIEAVVAQMREHQIRRMPVLDGAGKVVGIVTLSDLAKGITGPEQLQEAIRTLSEPHRSREAPDKDDARDPAATDSKSEGKTADAADKRG